MPLDNDMLSIDLDEWEWNEEFDVALTNTLATALNHVCTRTCETCVREPVCRIAFEARTAPYPDFSRKRWKSC